MRVSVLGAGSRLGRVVVGKLIAAGHEVTAVGDQHTLDLTRDLTASKARAVTETQLRLALRATQAVVNLLPLVDGIPPLRGRPGSPRRIDRPYRRRSASDNRR